MDYIFDSVNKYYSAVPKNNPKDKVEIEIGDAMDSTTFHPQFKLKRWDNEVNFSLRFLADSISGVQSITLENGVIEYTKGNYKARFYEKPAKTLQQPIEFTAVAYIDRGSIRPDQLVAEYELSNQLDSSRPLLTTSFLDRETILFYGHQSRSSYYDDTLNLPIYRFNTQHNANPMYADNNLGWFLFQYPKHNTQDYISILRRSVSVVLSRYGISVTEGGKKMFFEKDGVTYKFFSAAIDGDKLFAYVNLGTDYNRSMDLYKVGVDKDSEDPEGVQAGGLWIRDNTLPKSILQEVASEFIALIGKDQTLTTFDFIENKELLGLESLANDITWIEKGIRNDIKSIRDEEYEFEIEIPKKPPVNSVTFSIESKELDFFYQGELTEEEKVAGFYRTTDVIGSYAVYHKTRKGNNPDGKEYKTGKVFHIYRPHVIDSAGNETYADIHIDEVAKTLTITVGQTWLNNAIYPVIVDPTFGYTTAGASSTSLRGDFGGSVFTMPENGNVESITCYTNETLNDTYSIAVAVYLHSDSSKVVQSGEANNADASPKWLTGTVSSTALTNGTDYVLVAGFEDGGAYANHGLYYDSGSSNQGHTQAGTFDPLSLPDPATFSHSSYKYSIYATYTASGGGSLPVPKLSLLGVGS